MKAIIQYWFVRPNARGRRMVEYKVIGRKDNIVGKAQDHISEWLSHDNYIHAAKIKVKIVDHYGRPETSWQYSPTYR